MKIRKDEIPNGYAHCMATNGQCKQADRCLRALVMRLERKEEDWTLVNMVDPRYMASRNEKQPCEWFADANPKRFARGMSHIYDDVPAKVLKKVRKEVQDCFPSRTYYFKAKRGDKLISEEQQTEISEVFKENRINTQPAYDDFIETFEWNP